MNASQYLSLPELRALGLAHVGRHVFISRHAVLVYPERISIGDSVRIDPFSILMAKDRILIGNHVHIGSSVSINAVAEVRLEDFCGISAGTKIFTTDDDYSGDYLTGPTVDSTLTNIKISPVVVGRHYIVGANSVLLPGADLEEGAAVGALSLVTQAVPAWSIYGGVPARLLKPRSKALLRRAAALAHASDA